MRQGGLSWELSRRRLLPLLLVIILSIIGAHTVHGSSGNKKGFVIRKDNPALQNPEGVSNQRLYQLYNECSFKFVQIKKGGKKGRIDSRGRRKNKFTHLVFESHAGGHIYIRGLHQRKYICFNKKGKIILRYTETETCLFTEQTTSDNYTELRSVINPNWFLGFGKKGNRLKGHARTRPRKKHCFHFLVQQLTTRRQAYSPFDKTQTFRIKELIKPKS